MCNKIDLKNGKDKNIQTINAKNSYDRIVSIKRKLLLIKILYLLPLFALIATWLVYDYQNKNIRIRSFEIEVNGKKHKFIKTGHFVTVKTKNGDVFVLDAISGKAVTKTVYAKTQDGTVLRIGTNRIRLAKPNFWYYLSEMGIMIDEKPSIKNPPIILVVMAFFLPAIFLNIVYYFKRKRKQ